MEKQLKSIKFPGLEDTYVIPESKIEVDTELSETSENPVQNKVIKEVIDDLTAQIADAGSIDIDLTGSNEGEANSINADTLGGVKADEYIKKSDAMAVTKNYSVVGGPNQPENPTENMIWVQTETEEIGKVYFSGVNPSNCADNDIWISTSSNNSTVAFDSIRIGNDTMQTIYPLSAKQYVSGAWVDVDAKSYQDGAWVDWWFCIVSNGDINTPPGFGATLRNSTSPTLTDEGICLVANTVNSTSCGFATPEKCDTTNYKKLVLVCDITHVGTTANSGIGVGVGLATALNASSLTDFRNNIISKKNAGATGLQTLELDLTGYPGLYYPCVYMDVISGTNSKMYIYDLYMV